MSHLRAACGRKRLPHAEANGPAGLKLRLLFFLAGLLVLFLVVRRWPEPRAQTATIDQHEVGLARHLLARDRWQTTEFAAGHIHYLAGSHTARTSVTISAAVDSARKAALAFLELRDTQPIDVFFVDTREDMQRLIGRPIGGMVQSGERTALLVYSATYAPFLTHELTHLYTHNHWGAPRNGRWISEGLAALATGDCQAHSLDALVKGLHDAGELHTWTELASRFNDVDEIAANLEAASIVRHLRGRGGIRAVRAVWMSEGWAEFERTFRQPLTEIERGWLQRVRAVPVSARLDVRRLHEHGCDIVNRAETLEN